MTLYTVPYETLFIYFTVFHLNLTFEYYVLIVSAILALISYIFCYIPMLWAPRFNCILRYRGLTRRVDSQVQKVMIGEFLLDGAAVPTAGPDSGRLSLC